MTLAALADMAELDAARSRFFSRLIAASFAPRLGKVDQQQTRHDQPERLRRILPARVIDQHHAEQTTFVPEVK